MFEYNGFPVIIARSLLCKGKEIFLTKEDFYFINNTYVLTLAALRNVMTMESFETPFANSAFIEVNRKTKNLQQ